MEKPQILAWLGLPHAGRRKAAELYGAVVAAARQPRLYAECGVPDTPEGRYEMVVLHLALLIGRLQGSDGAGRLARNLSEAFVTDMDDCLREMGVGDLAVPKRVKRAASGLYERAALYRGALSGGDPEAALATALAAVIPGLGAPAMLVAHVLDTNRRLAAQSIDAIMAGTVRFEG